MYASDFEYDGRLLSSYGFIICEFGQSGDLNIVDSGSDITFNRVKRNNGKRYGLASTQFDECVQATFQICKNPDEFSNTIIEDYEYRELVRWLNRHQFLKFRLIKEIGGEDTNACYFNASFNIQKVFVSDELYGLALTVETDAPFGHGRPYERTWEVAANGSVQIDDLSDDAGFTYPEITIVCKASGDLVVTNTTFSNTMQIKNCMAGERISINGDTQIITTTLSSHKIYNDFNYEFLPVGNDVSGCRNVITFSQPCTVTFKYSPIIKDIV